MDAKQGMWVQDEAQTNSALSIWDLLVLWGWAPPFSLIPFPDTGNPHMKFSRVRAPISIYFCLQGERLRVMRGNLFGQALPVLPTGAQLHAQDSHWLHAGICLSMIISHNISVLGKPQQNILRS